ncbi:MAG: hypothetical protein Q9203_004117 [Teloschistes exilis]
MADAAEEVEREVEAGGAKQTAKDLFAGAMGGVAQVLLGQPFDIVKVRLQTTTRYTGAIDAATRIFKDEGPLAFYKVSVQFGGFHYARRQFEASNALRSSSPALSYTQLFASGAFAGLSNSFLSGPIEHVRIRLQTQPHGAGRLYGGPLDCVRKLSSQGGGVSKGVYRGQAVTVSNFRILDESPRGILQHAPLRGLRPPHRTLRRSGGRSALAVLVSVRCGEEQDAERRIRITDEVSVDERVLPAGVARGGDEGVLERFGAYAGEGDAN